MTDDQLRVPLAARRALAIKKMTDDAAVLQARVTLPRSVIEMNDHVARMAKATAVTNSIVVSAERAAEIARPHVAMPRPTIKSALAELEAQNAELEAEMDAAAEVVAAERRADAERSDQMLAALQSVAATLTASSAETQYATSVTVATFRAAIVAVLVAVVGTAWAISGGVAATVAVGVAGAVFSALAWWASNRSRPT